MASLKSPRVMSSNLKDNRLKKIKKIQTKWPMPV